MINIELKNIYNKKEKYYIKLENISKIEIKFFIRSIFSHYLLIINLRLYKIKLITIQKKKISFNIAFFMFQYNIKENLIYLLTRQI